MKIIPPFNVTPSTLMDTNVPIDDYDEYDPSEHYNLGDRVIVLSTLSVYESVSETPIHNISPISPEGATVWLKVGAVNRWRCFDTKVGSATKGAFPFDPTEYSVNQDVPGFDPLEEPNEGITYKIRVLDGSDSISLFNLSGYFVDILVETTDGIIYKRRIPLGGELQDSNWYSYFNEPLYRLDRITITDLPQTPEKDIYISVVETTEGEIAQVGEIVIGRAIPIGKSLYGVNLDFLDFSTKERNEFGEFEIVERAYADGIEIPLSIENDKIFFIRKTVADLRAKPAVYIAGECIEGTAVYGYITEFSIVINGPKRSDAVMRIAGLI